MKQYISKIIVGTLIITALAVSASAQVYVNVRPFAPRIVRPIAPSPRHIWVDGEWAWRGGRYEYVSGYWAAPPRPGIRWVPGHWKQNRRGWFWVPGRWR